MQKDSGEICNVLASSHTQIPLVSCWRRSRQMIIRNEDIKELVAEIPEGHRHLRTTIILHDGTELVFQEATVSNLVRAFITVKTHPAITRVTLRGKHLRERKEGYAEWQLTEEDHD